MSPKDLRENQSDHNAVVRGQRDSDPIPRVIDSDKYMSVSVIIPTFNGASRIGNCLEALLELIAGIDAEIIVVNDGSTDNTIEAVRAYPQVRLRKQLNSGAAAARNRGAADQS